MEEKSKLRLYRSLKSELGYEEYLDVEDRWLRRRMTKLRRGTNWLRVELERGGPGREEVRVL